MGISDWSSDVCSSDLFWSTTIFRCQFPVAASRMRYQPRLSGGDKFAFVRGARPAERTDRARSSTISAPTDDASAGDAGYASRDTRPRRADEPDRKRVVQGKSVSVRVDLGGRRFITQKK